MPILEAHILEGYDSEEKARLITALTDAVRLVVPAPDEAIIVMLKEHPGDDYARGGVQRKPASALPDPTVIVRDYLTAMENRELEKATAMLGEEFRMVFPATDEMVNLSELIEWSKNRYRFVKKTYDAVESFFQNGTTIVYVRGKLRGEWMDGTAFDGIRYIDRFELSGGKIQRQDVWNDMAEVRSK